MIPKCPNCGYGLNPAAAALHLQACALAVQCRIDESLGTIATRPPSAPERFQIGGE